MKKAIIDIGTNSLRILIAEVNNSNIKKIKKYSEITRLGKGVDSNKNISEAVMLYNISILQKFIDIAHEYDVKEINAFATSAVRDAANKEEFIRLVKAKTGIEINVITGKQEAEAGFKGAVAVLPNSSGIVLDIGGGSTELIYGIDGQVLFSKSMDMGSVRLTERYFKQEITLKNMEAAENYIKILLHKNDDKINSLIKYNYLSGIGGTITSLAAIDSNMKIYDPDKIHNYKLKKKSIDSIFKRLSDISNDDREKIIGLQEGRADIITAGTLILKVILEYLSIDTIIVSESDNLEGMMLSRSK